MATSKKNTQHKLDRLRPPRVQITYDVGIGNAIQTKEIPFVLGVVSDLSGQPKEPLPKLKERKFVQVDRDNFDGVLYGMAPRLAMRVPNKLKEEDDSLLSVELTFDRLEDFEPENVVKQVAPLNRLLEVRQKLSDLRNKMTGNDTLNDLLEDIVRDSDKLKQIQEQSGKTGDDK
jgi:type VI secretion system protein ImpB